MLLLICSICTATIWNVKEIRFTQKLKFCHLLRHSTPVWLSFFCRTQKQILRNVSVFLSIQWNSTLTKTFGYQHFSKYLKNSKTCRFGTTWGWVNNDSILIFGRILYSYSCVITIHDQISHFKNIHKKLIIALWVYLMMCYLMRCWNRSACERERERKKCKLRTTWNPMLEHPMKWN